MEPCEKLSALLDAFIDGELPEAEANQVRRHLAECENCRAYVADAFAMRDALEDLADIQVPEGFSQTVMDAVRNAPPNFLEVAGISVYLYPGRSLWCQE